MYICILTCLTGGVQEKEHDSFSFRGAWLLFLFSLVASLLCLSPHCTLAMKWSRIVKGLVALAAFYFFGTLYPCRLNTPTLHWDRVLRTAEALEAVNV